ncbi:MAG TPA: hypothetical protein VJ276_00545 [Thermoanaerobaculia bacterium]|nr:hypothetical protein [Thermoanaerobaculia bacterium]
MTESIPRTAEMRLIQGQRLDVGSKKTALSLTARNDNCADGFVILAPGVILSRMRRRRIRTDLAPRL